MNYFYAIIVSLLLTSCAKEVFPGDHSDESVSIMLIAPDGRSTVGFSIGTTLGETNGGGSGRFDDAKVEMKASVSKVTEEGFFLTYHVELLIVGQHLDPISGGAEISYNENEIIELDQGYKIRVISHEGDVDPNELK